MNKRVDARRDEERMVNRSHERKVEQLGTKTHLFRNS